MGLPWTKHFKDLRKIDKYYGQYFKYFKYLSYFGMETLTSKFRYIVINIVIVIVIYKMYIVQYITILS